MKQINFYVDLCRINSILSLATLVNVDISVGNIFARSKYICLCEIAEIEDDTNDDDWTEPKGIVKNVTSLLVNNYIQFLSLLRKAIEHPEYIDEIPDLFLSTLEFAKTIYVVYDFVDDEIIELLQVFLRKAKDKQMKEHLASAIHSFKFDKMKMRGDEFIIGSLTGKAFEA